MKMTAASRFMMVQMTYRPWCGQSGRKSN